MDGELRRNTILAAAMPLFARYGFEGTTTKQIASQAGVSEALLYRHFKGKRAIYLALKDYCCDQKDHISASIHALPDTTATLINSMYFKMALIFLGREIGPVEHRARHEQLTRLMAHSCLEKGNFARAFFQEHAQDWTAKWSACLAAAHKAGDLVFYEASDIDSLWFGHHLAVAMLMFTLAPQSVIPFQAPDKFALLDKAVLFTLRGMGLKQEVLTAHYEPKSLMLFTQTMFQ